MAAPPPMMAPPPPETPRTVEEEEILLARAWEGRGLKHKGILRLMALDSVKWEYRRPLARARGLAREKDLAGAIRLLDSSLNALPEEHLLGRLSMLKALEVLCRRSGRFSELDSVRGHLKEVRKALADQCLEAAREGGLVPDAAQKIMAKLEEKTRHQDNSDRGADWLSGRDLGPDAALGN